MSDTTYTPLTWAKELLRRVGAPDTPANESAIVGWEAAEGGHWRNPDRFNPLDTTEREPGSHGTNSVGVQAYTSWEQGFDATVTTLLNGLYAPILAALQSGRSASAVDAAVAASPWGTHQLSPAPIDSGYALLRSSGPTGTSAGGSSVPPDASGSSASDTSSGGCSSPAGASVVNPAAWASFVLCRLEQDAKPALFTGTAVLAGAGLVVLGLWRTVSKTNTYKTVRANVTSAAEAGAAAA